MWRWIVLAIERLQAVPTETPSAELGYTDGIFAPFRRFESRKRRSSCDMVTHIGT